MPTIILYACLALALMGGIGWGYKTVKDSGRDEVRAELQPKLTACQGQITALAEETARKQAQSVQALRKAEGRAKVWEDNSKRLRDALTSRKPDGPQDCKSAWSAIRNDTPDRK